MAAGLSAPSRKGVYRWFQRNESRLFAIDIVCIVVLFFMHLFMSTLDVLPPQVTSAVQVAAAIPVAFIALSVLWKGVVPLVICTLGIVLMYSAITLPYYQEDSSQFGENARRRYNPEAALMETNLHFFLGAAMAALSITIVRRPSILFTRNRPESLDSEWSRYPVWHDNVLLADGHAEPSVSVKSLMTDQDRCLLWRYEYVLASVHGAPHLVSPQGMVPKGSSVLRDKESGRVMGKARYNGYFM